DIRDATREGVHYARGEPTDELVLGLACVGMAVTVGTFASRGAASPARVGLTIVKAGRKAGWLSAHMASWATRSVRDVVDMDAMRRALAPASILQPAIAVRAARDAVKLEKAEVLEDRCRGE